jgi:hypothetical protein
MSKAEEATGEEWVWSEELKMRKVAIDNPEGYSVLRCIGHH